MNNLLQKEMKQMSVHKPFGDIEYDKQEVIRISPSKKLIIQAISRARNSLR